MKRFVNCNFYFIDARSKKECKLRLVERLKPFSGVVRVIISLTLRNGFCSSQKIHIHAVFGGVKNAKCLHSGVTLSHILKIVWSLSVVYT